MRNIKDLEVEEAGVLDDNLNRFYGKSGDFMFEVRQPRKDDSSQHRKTWSKLSRRTIREYMRLYEDPIIYDSKWRCKQPLYHGEIPGFIPLIMVVDGRIVGFADQMFKYGDKFMLHGLEKDEVGCSMNLCVVDKYQGLGYGSFYSHISVFIAKYFKADYALGYTRVKKGMYGIRVKQGWETMGRRGNYVVIRKRL